MHLCQMAIIIYLDISLLDGHQRVSWWLTYTIISNQLTSMVAIHGTHASHIIPRQFLCRLKVLPGSSFFASFSDDGTTKLWDVNKMEGLHVINKPRGTYSQGTSINEHTTCIVFVSPTCTCTCWLCNSVLLDFVCIMYRLHYKLWLWILI